jgi:NAD(P)-dependent dehydrogenase (short-subunit alcohol dehydrogenase family)
MNRTALITGASRGIGRGIALALAPLGYDLLINFARNEAAARQTADDCRAAARAAGRDIRVECHRADIASSAEREDLVARARAAFDHLDLLVNNAGIAPTVRADLLEATEESFDQLVATNLKGPCFLTQRVARWMIESGACPAPEPAARPPARIIFVSSISAYTASVNRGDYCVSKAGLAMLVKLFAARLAPHGIGVYEVRPGIIATDMTGPVREKYDRLIAEGLTPIRRWGTPADVGRAVAAIASDLLPFSTGEVLNVDGGFHLRTL